EPRDRGPREEEQDMLHALRNVLAATAFVVAATMGIGTGTASADPVHTLKLGHILAPDSPDNLAFLYLAKRVEELTNGEVVVEVYPASQLGAVDVMMESLKTGSLDMMVELLEFWANSEKRLGVVGVPYLFESREHFARFLQSDTFHKIADD